MCYMILKFHNLILCVYIGMYNSFTYLIRFLYLKTYLMLYKLNVLRSGGNVEVLHYLHKCSGWTFDHLFVSVVRMQFHAIVIVLCIRLNVGYIRCLEPYNLYFVYSCNGRTTCAYFSSIMRQSPYGIWRQ